MDNQPTQPQQPASIQPSAEQHPSHKILYIIAGIVLLILALAGGYVLGQQNSASQITYPGPSLPVQVTTVPTIDETADWKTYSNTKYGYSLKYPIEWVLFPDGKDATGGENTTTIANFDIATSVPRKGSPTDMRVYIEVNKRTPAMKLDDICKPGGPILIISCESTTLAGLPAQKRVDGNPESSTSVFLLSDNYLYSVTMSYATATPATKELFDQILSTFKFTQ